VATSLKRLMGKIGFKFGRGGQLQRQLWWRNAVEGISYVRQVCSDLSAILRELSRLARA